MVGLRERRGKLLKTGMLSIGSQTVEDIIALARRLQQKVKGGVGGEASVFSTEGLGKEAIEDGDDFVASPLAGHRPQKRHSDWRLDRGTG